MRFEPNGPGPAAAGEDDVLDVAAMVDVVFILLTFFVLTATFGNERDLGVGSDPPTAPGGSASEADLPRRITIHLHPASSPEEVAITVGRATLPDNGYDAITRKLNEIDVPSIPVTIAADPRLSVRQVSRAMDAVLASPMRRISLARIRSSAEPAP